MDEKILHTVRHDKKANGNTSLIQDKGGNAMDGYRAVLQTILRSAAAVLTLQLLTRINGAKQISQLSFYDYITGITIGSMAAYMAVDEQIPVWVPIIAIAVFVTASYIENRWALYSLKARKVIDGMPTLLMANGKLIQDHMKKAHLTVNDLLSEARVAGYFDLSQIAFALMEKNGKISFLPYPHDMEHKKEQTAMLLINVIIDGEILESELHKIHKDVAWLMQKLYDEQLTLADVLLATADHKGNIHIFRKAYASKQEQYFL